MEGDNEFQKWLDDAIKQYKLLKDDERTKTLDKLLQASSPRQLWYLQQRMRNLVYCDILSLLPSELQEHLLMFLEPKFLLKCCQVSHSWNKIVTTHENVWYNACKTFNWQLIDDERPKSSVNWKNMYIKLSRFSDTMMKSLAFTSHSYCSESRITAVCYWNGKIVTGSEDKHIQIWDAEKEECIYTINAECSISGIKADGNIMVISSYVGCLKYYAFGESFRMCHSFDFHTGAVLSLDFCGKLDLLISGAADNLVFLWSLSSGRRLKVLRDHSHWVVAVKLVNKIGSSCLILSMDRDAIYVTNLCWQNRLMDVTCIQRIHIGIPDCNFFTPGLECDGRFIYFIKQDPRKSGYTLFCCWDINQKKLIKQQEMNMAVKLLLSVGKKFACVITPWSDDNTPNFLVLRITDLKTVAQWHLPSPSPSTPQIGIANMSWLNGLTGKNHTGIILAAVYGLQNRFLYVLKWKDNLIFNDV